MCIVTCYSHPYHIHAHTHAHEHNNPQKNTPTHMHTERERDRERKRERERKKENTDRNIHQNACTFPRATHTQRSTQTHISHTPLTSAQTHSQTTWACFDGTATGLDYKDQKASGSY